MENAGELSENGMFEVSQNDNTFVFILDCFDAQLFCNLLQEQPELLKSEFEDFTFYHNTVGGATRTQYAIPYILTGQTNILPDSYITYLEKSFGESALITEFKEDNCDARLYTNPFYVDMSQTKAIANIVYGSSEPTSQLLGDEF